MFTTSTVPTRRGALAAVMVAAAAALILLAAGGLARQPAAGRRPAAPSAGQAPAKIVADPPTPDLLAEGVAVVRFRAENVQVVPVFGPAAAAVSPRLGHLHVTLDDAPWHWAHTSTDPVIVAPLPPGPHKLLLELADADHKVLAKETVTFEVPRR